MIGGKLYHIKYACLRIELDPRNPFFNTALTKPFSLAFDRALVSQTVGLCDNDE